MHVALFVFWITLLALCVVFLVRNNVVFKYRTNLISRISTAGKKDISLKRDWQWRWHEYDAVNYNDMVFKFWRKPDSFYPADPARLEK